MHFEDVDDLLHAIDALQHYNIPICEVHTPVQIPGIETKLRIKNIRLGYTALKYGCLGGTAITTLAYYILGQKTGGMPALSILFTALIVLVTFFIATRLFPGSAPKVIDLQPDDNRYLILVDANNIAQNEDLNRLFNYAAAVEISSSIKHIVIS
jgi:hypothetical protein